MVKLNAGGGGVKRQNEDSSSTKSKENLNPSGSELKSSRRSFNTKKLRRTVSFLNTNTSPPPLPNNSSSNVQNLKSKLLNHIQSNSKKTSSKQSFYEQQRRRRLSLNYNLGKSRSEIDEDTEEDDEQLRGADFVEFVDLSPQMTESCQQIETNSSSERKAKSFHAIKSQLKKYAEELKTVSVVSGEKSNSLSSKASKLANRVFKLKEKNTTTTASSNLRDLSLDMILDKNLKTYLETKSSLDEEKSPDIKKKIDFELRILDGVLKMLNAQNSSTGNNNTPPLSAIGFSFDTQPVVVKTPTDFLPSVRNYSPISGMSSDTDSATFESDSRSYYKACEENGVSIARSIFSLYQEANPTITTTTSNSNSSSTNSSNLLLNSVLKQLELYRCLFVSRRKLDVYLQKLNYDSNNDDDPRPNTTPGYVILKDLSIPLYNLKWSDHLKAIRINENNENGSSGNTGKQRSQTSTGHTFAFFALVYSSKLGIVHDTKLHSIDTSTSREISFNQTFKFENVQAGDEFDIEIEVYSYDLNALDSGGMVHQHFAKRLARQLGKSKVPNSVVDAAASGLDENGDEEDESTRPKKDKLNEWLANVLPNSANLNTSRFRLVATARLTQHDLVVNSTSSIDETGVADPANKMSFSEHFFSSNFDTNYQESESSFVYEANDQEWSTTATTTDSRPVYKQALQCKPLKLSGVTPIDGSSFFVSNETSKSLLASSPPLYDFYTCRFYDSSDSSII